MECIRSTYFYYWLSNLCKPGSQPRLAKPSGSFLPLWILMLFSSVPALQVFNMLIPYTACMYVLGAFVNLCGLNCWKCQSSNANIYPSIWCTIELILFISSVLLDPKCICVWYLIYTDPFPVAISYLYDEQSVITRFYIFTRCAAILLFCAGLLR